MQRLTPVVFFVWRRKGRKRKNVERPDQDGEQNKRPMRLPECWNHKQQRTSKRSRGHRQARKPDSGGVEPGGERLRESPVVDEFPYRVTAEAGDAKNATEKTKGQTGEKSTPFQTPEFIHFPKVSGLHS